MEKIDNREKANKYYNIINELIDDYIDKWGIKPSRLKNYLKPGTERFERFLIKNNLNNIIGTKKILKDVIDDITAMESDGVLTFESYTENNIMIDENDIKIENYLFKGIEKPKLEYEKALADYFNTSLADINIIDSDKHLFSVSSWDETPEKVIIYSKEDFKLICSNLKYFIFEEINTKSIESSIGINIELKGLINEESLISQLRNNINDDFCIKMITKVLDFDFEKEYLNYFIWIKN